MKKKHFLVIGLIVIPIAAGVIIRETGTRYGHDARALAAPSFDNSRVIGWEQLAAMKQNTLVVDLSSQGVLLQDSRAGMVHIPAAQLLEQASIDTLRAHSGDMRILYSPDPGEAARAWMMLVQMGYRNMYILSDDPKEEEMKYPFQPASETQTETEE